MSGTIGEHVATKTDIAGLKTDIAVVRTEIAELKAVLTWLIGWGPEAQTFDETLRARWFDHYLKGVDNGIDREPDVRIPAEP